MPIYNRGSLVARAIDSLSNQTFEDFQLILIDDASTDNGLIQAVHCAKTLKHPAIPYRLPKNSGVGAALNAGALAGNPFTQWLTRLDSDDEYASTYLESRYKAIKLNPGIDLFYGGIKAVNGLDTVPDARDITATIPISETSQGGTLVVKIEVFRKLGGFPERRFGEDFAFLEIAKKTNLQIKKLELNDYLYYRDTPNSLTRI